jgi:hypothetical protein
MSLTEANVQSLLAASQIGTACWNQRAVTPSSQRAAGARAMQDLAETQHFPSSLACNIPINHESAPQTACASYESASLDAQESE